MADVPPGRSRLMQRIKSKNTKPEIAVRRLLHKQGFRFRIHRSDLAGRPDIVLSRFRTAIFVHGCFWHRHPCCSKATTPKTRAAFWADKFDANVARDRRNIELLRTAGWHVLVIWECETKDLDTLSSRISQVIKREACDGGKVV